MRKRCPIELHELDRLESSLQKAPIKKARPKLACLRMSKNKSSTYFFFSTWIVCRCKRGENFFNLSFSPPDLRRR